MKVDMIYDGQQLNWIGRGYYKASSGLTGHQMPEQQCTADSGPIPEGMYKLFITDQGIAEDDGRGLCAIKPSWGIQKIPRGKLAGACEPYWANWGDNRARMEPADSITKAKCSPLVRGGFYLHDSTKGFSHGCIEVETSIFSVLRKHQKDTQIKTLIIQVKYVAGRSTYGGTKI